MRLRNPSMSVADVVTIALSAVGVSLIAYQAFRAKAAPEPSTSIAPPPTTGPLLVSGDTWALYGDSLVGGPAGSPNPGGLTPPLQKLSDSASIGFHSQGIKSTTIQQWARKTTSGELTAADTAYTVVAINLGSNDTWMTQGIDEREAIRTLVTFFAQKGATVVWIIPPTLVDTESPRREDLLQQLHEMSDQVGFVLWSPGHIDLETGPRRVHPTAEGYRQMASNLFAFLT